MICPEYIEPTYLLFASDLPELLYYSHLPATVLSLLVGFVVFLQNTRALPNRLLLAITLLFSCWTFFNLITWTNIHSEVVLFAWSLLNPIQGLIAISCIYFAHVFFKKSDLPFKQKLVLIFLVSPLLILGHSNANLSGFDLNECDAFAFEEPLYALYSFILGTIAIVWIANMAFQKYRSETNLNKSKIILFTFGIESFLIFFYFITSITWYLTGIGTFDDSRVEFFGLFGMIIFMVFVSILIVRFRAFNITILAPQALVIALFLLVGSQFTYNETATSFILTTVTLLMTAIIGIFLVRSVSSEVEQRKTNELLVKDLAEANVRLTELDKLKSEFVSIASHQLRSPLTSMRGYATMLLEGAYGHIPDKAREAVSRISDSSAFLARMVENYLNVSRIEAGNMKYEITTFSLKNEVELIVNDKRQEAVHKGLMLIFTSNLTTTGLAEADRGKTIEIIHNLLNNALKYTKNGTIHVKLTDDLKNKKIFIDINDTGIGMCEEDIKKLFTKFERARNANDANITGTGLGLYVAQTMAKAMKGNITAKSEGLGKGSVFRLELPLVG